MKKIILLFIFSFWSMLLAQPVIFIEKTQIDLGIVEESSDVFYNIKIENRGIEELLIYNIQSTCKCTVLEYPKSIPPKAEGVLKVVIEPKAKKGKWYVALRIDSNDPNTPNLPLKIDLNVIPIFEFEHLEREELIFEESELKTIKLRIFTKLRKSFSIYDIKVFPEGIIAMPTPDYFSEVEGQEGFIVELHFSSPLPKGKHIIELSILTSLQELPKVAYSFPVIIKNYINAEPETLTFSIKGNPATLTSKNLDSFIYSLPNNDTKTKLKIIRGPAYKILNYKNGFFLIEYSKKENFWVHEEDIQILDANYNGLVKISSMKNIKFNIVNIETPEGFRYLINKKNDSEYLINFWYNKIEPFTVNGLLIKIYTDFAKNKELIINLNDLKTINPEQRNKSKKLEKK